MESLSAHKISEELIKHSSEPPILSRVWKVSPVHAIRATRANLVALRLLQCLKTLMAA